MSTSVLYSAMQLYLLEWELSVLCVYRIRNGCLISKECLTPDRRNGSEIEKFELFRTQLFNKQLSVQLSDFGLAKWAPTDVQFIRCNDVVGTFG